jgi:hypothetical protein
MSKRTTPRIDDVIARLEAIRAKHGNVRCVCAEAVGSDIDYYYPLRVWLKKVRLWVSDGKLKDEKVAVFPITGEPL